MSTFVFLLLMLTVVNCFVLMNDASLIPRADLFSFDEGTSEDLIDFNLPVGNVDEDSSDSLDGLPPIDSIEQSFFNMDPGLAIDSSLATESDIDDASLLLAESSQADYCSFSTSLVPDGLQISRRKTTCQDTGSSSGASGAGNALNVNPKVAPYLSLDNLGNMELNEICPPKSLINMYYVPVCSSPYKMNTRKSPYFPPYWKLFRAQLITVGVLLSCHTNRFIFCCDKFVEDIFEPPDFYQPGEPVIQFTGFGSKCQFLDPADEVIFRISPF